jgi:hypothetical protein
MRSADLDPGVLPRRHIGTAFPVEDLMKLATTGIRTLALVMLLGGNALAQETRPPEGPGAPKPAEPGAQPPPDQTIPPAAPDQPVSPAPLAPSEPTVTPLPVAPAPEPLPTSRTGRRLIFDVGLGYTTGGQVKHPELIGTTFAGEMLELGGGVELDPRFQLLLVFTSFQTKIERIGTSNRFQRTTDAVHAISGVHPLASCVIDCGSSAGTGGLLVKAPLHVHTLGPRLDFLPFGSNGPFVGATAGAAIMQDLSFRGGFAVAARIGYEYTPFDIMGVLLEVGAHGQVYSDSSATLPYVSLQLRLLADPSMYRAAPLVPPRDQVGRAPDGGRSARF